MQWKDASSFFFRLLAVSLFGVSTGSSMELSGRTTRPKILRLRFSGVFVIGEAIGEAIGEDSIAMGVLHIMEDGAEGQSTVLRLILRSARVEEGALLEAGAGGAGDSVLADIDEDGAGNSGKSALGDMGGDAGDAVRTGAVTRAALLRVALGNSTVEAGSSSLAGSSARAGAGISAGKRRGAAGASAAASR